MNWFDIAILAVLAFSVLVGLMRGVVAELLSIGVWIAAFVVARLYGPTASGYFSRYIANPEALLLAGYVACFVLVLVAGAIFRLLIGRMLQATGLSGIDRMLGMGFGFVRGVLLIALAVFLLDLALPPPQVWSQDSQLLPSVRPLAAWLGAQLPRIHPPAALADYASRIPALPSADLSAARSDRTQNFLDFSRPAAASTPGSPSEPGRPTPATSSTIY